MKVNINGQCHMTKMATMAINSQKNFIYLILQKVRTYDFETLPEASVNGALQSLYNHDLRITLTYFMAWSGYVAYPRSQVSVYRTIGPLVLIHKNNQHYSLENRASKVNEENMMYPYTLT